jgi:hypothetical protein
VQQCVVGARKFEVVEREQLKAAMSEQSRRWPLQALRTVRTQTLLSLAR